MTHRARNGLFGLLILTTPLAACARPAADAGATASAPAIASTIAQSSAPQIVTGLPDFTRLVETVGPGVVNIEAKVSPKSARTQQFGDDEEIPEFFRRILPPGFQIPGPQQPRGGLSMGSGFIISPDGYVLTNHHVVDGADTVTVKLTDRRELKAKVVGSDPQYDVALLKIEASGLPSIRVGSSNTLKPGQWVVAIGSPLGLDHSVTAGIVSAVGRSTSAEQRYVPFIQTDVAINQGNSGGPLLNTSGEVVGINSQILSGTGGYMGVSFAIPIDLAMNAAEQIKKTGKVQRGQVGVVLQPINASEAKGLGLPDTRGALISSVQPGSAGEKAGLEPGDVIRAVNGRQVEDSAQVPPMIGAMAPGTKVTLGIWRNGKMREVAVTLTALKEDSLASNYSDDEEGAAPDTPATGKAELLGLRVAGLGAGERKQLGLEADEGIRITGVDGPAAEARLQPGLLITRVRNAKIGSVAAFDKALAGIKPGDVVMLLVLNPRSGASQFVAVTAGEE